MTQVLTENHESDVGMAFLLDEMRCVRVNRLVVVQMEG